VATRASLAEGVTEFALVAIRSAGAAVLLAGYLIVRRGGFTRSTQDWRTGAVLGLTNLAAPFVLLTYALVNASAGFVGLLVALVPLATATLAHYLLPEERMHAAKAVGLLTALGGVALLLLSGDSGLATGGRPLLSFGLAVGGVLFIAYAAIYAKRRAAGYDTLQLAAAQFVVGAVVMVVLALLIEGTPDAYSAWAWTLLAYLTVAGTIAPFVAYYWLLRHVSATRASLIGYLVPLVALLSGIVLIDERLQFGIGFGGVLILAGVILTERAERVGVASRHSFQAPGVAMRPEDTR
ncbi:MAG: DMT family transporter, partial [Acidimicrobiia bacterium]